MGGREGRRRSPEMPVGGNAPLPQAGAIVLSSSLIKIMRKNMTTARKIVMLMTRKIVAVIMPMRRKIVMALTRKILKVIMALTRKSHLDKGGLSDPTYWTVCPRSAHTLLSLLNR